MPDPLMLADAYVHGLDPVILPIRGEFAIRWYGVSYLAGFVLAWIMLRFLARRGRIGIRAEEAGDFMFYAVAGVIIGGRMGYVLFYDLLRAFDTGVTPLLWDFSSQFPFWGVLRVTGGGMSAHGGLLGVIISQYIFARRRRIAYLHVMDFAALATPLGLGLGRVANFINGELWGKELPLDQQGANAPWWSIKYPEQLSFLASQGDSDFVKHAPAIAQAAGLDPVAFGSHLANYVNVNVLSNESRRLVDRWIAQIIEQVREGNEALEAALQPVLTAYYPSQIFQAIAEGPVLLLFLAMVWLTPRRPGTVSAWFLLAYGVLRIVTELFRQPDEDVALFMGLISRGQLLSALMILGAVVLFGFVRWFDAPRMGGLLRPAPHATSPPAAN